MTFRKIGDGGKPLVCRSRIRKIIKVICPTDATTNKSARIFAMSETKEETTNLNGNNVFSECENNLE